MNTKLTHRPNRSQLPENREYTAEVMFETQRPGPTLRCRTFWRCARPNWQQGADDARVTGTVIDSGDGRCHPVVDGYVIEVASATLAGRNVTNFVSNLLETVERSSLRRPTRRGQIIKEKYCYLCKDLVNEFAAYDADDDMDPKFKKLHLHKKTGKTYNVDVGYERFLGPEIFAEFFDEQFATPLSDWLIPICNTL